MSEAPQKLGYFVSGAMHLALLGMIVFGFASAPKFDDASESLPVETVTRAQMNEIMQGEKNAKPQPTPPLPPTKPVQQTAAEPVPQPPTPPEPPPELKRADDPPPPPPPKPPEPKPAPTPPPKLEIKEAKDAPEPPVKPKLPPPPPEKPKDPPPEKFKPDLLAKLLKDPPKPTPTSTTKPYDPNAIAKLLGPTKVADATPTGSAPQGLPNHHAARMSVTMRSAMDDWFRDTYLSCWNRPPTIPEGGAYVPEVKLDYNSDGTLATNPVLLNPPSDPAWRPLAESAVRAALKCNPLRVPAQYAPYFDDWRAKTIHFDPTEVQG